MKLAKAGELKDRAAQDETYHGMARQRAVKQGAHGSQLGHLLTLNIHAVASMCGSHHQRPGNQLLQQCASPGLAVKPDATQGCFLRLTLSS